MSAEESESSVLPASLTHDEQIAYLAKLQQEKKKAEEDHEFLQQCLRMQADTEATRASSARMRASMSASSRDRDVKPVLSISPPSTPRGSRGIVAGGQHADGVRVKVEPGERARLKPISQEMIDLTGSDSDEAMDTEEGIISAALIENDSAYKNMDANSPPTEEASDQTRIVAEPTGDEQRPLDPLSKLPSTTADDSRIPAPLYRPKKRSLKRVGGIKTGERAPQKSLKSTGLPKPMRYWKPRPIDAQGEASSSTPHGPVEAGQSGSYGPNDATPTFEMVSVRYKGPVLSEISTRAISAHLDKGWKEAQLCKTSLKQLAAWWSIVPVMEAHDLGKLELWLLASATFQWWQALEARWRSPLAETGPEKAGILVKVMKEIRLGKESREVKADMDCEGLMKDDKAVYMLDPPYKKMTKVKIEDSSDSDEDMATGGVTMG